MSIGQYDYEGLVISYLIQEYPSAKTARDRMSYNGIKLYSYCSILAEMDAVKKTLYVREETANYSNTSRTHARILYKYASNFTVFTIETYDSVSEENLQNYWNQIEPLVIKYKRARTRKLTYKWEIQRIVQTAKLYAELHGFDQTVPDNILRMLFVNCLL